MVKEIVKIIISCIVVYPIGLLMMHLEGPKSENNWLVALVLDIIVCVGLIANAIVKKRKKTKM